MKICTIRKFPAIGYSPDLTKSVTCNSYRKSHDHLGRYHMGMGEKTAPLLRVKILHLCEGCYHQRNPTLIATYVVACNKLLILT